MDFDPFNMLADKEQRVFELNIRKRHVIGHDLGVADATFVEQAVGAKLGETVKLVGADIRTFAAPGQKVIDGLDNWLASANVLGALHSGRRFVDVVVLGYGCAVPGTSTHCLVRP